MPRRLPVFPLDVVLFPGTPLPLHIFEPRYRTMLADCLEGDERFGVVPAAEGASPEPGVVGCIAHIRATQLLADGRSNIVVIGENRFVLKEYLSESLPYAVALVDEFEDEETATVTAEAIKELKNLSRKYLDLLHRLNDSSAPDTDFPDDPAVFSFHVAAALELGVEPKQRLLAVRSTAERIRLLLRLLPPLVADHESRVAEHEHARTNGKSRRPWQLGS